MIKTLVAARDTYPPSSLEFLTLPAYHSRYLSISVKEFRKFDLSVSQKSNGVTLQSAHGAGMIRPTRT